MQQTACKQRYAGSGPGEMANRNFMRIRYSRRNNQFAESFPVIVRRGQRRQRNRQKDGTGVKRGRGEEEKRFAHNGGLKMLAWPGRIEVFYTADNNF